ncbi:MAG: hypothetical protein M3177_06130 [Pseudomonadota bacterium]|nr:hypothetical protein [Pseudomonadota bacterium]
MGHNSNLPLPTDFQAKDVVSLYSAQNSALNQLWAMYVAATFTAGIFAVTASNAQSRTLLLAGGIGFLAFTIGHAVMVVATLRLMRAGADDIKRVLNRTDSHSCSLVRLGKAPKLWGAIVVHAVIDTCVVAAYAFLITKVQAW